MVKYGRQNWILYMGALFWVVAVAFLLTAGYIGYDVAKFIHGAAKKTENGVEILYTPAYPEANRINDFWHLWVVPLAFTFLAAVMGFIGRTMVQAYNLKSDWQEDLRTSGKRISAEFDHIKNGNQIVARWRNPENSKTYIFKSQKMDIDVRSLPEDSKIDVYINPRYPKQYFLDTSFLKAHS